MVSQTSLELVRSVVNKSLERACEIRTYEVWSQCNKNNVNLDYKTIGMALRIIMEEEIRKENVVKLKLGCWRVIKPTRSMPLPFVHPIDDKKKSQVELEEKCEKALVECGKHKDERTILDACERNGISIRTFINYLTIKKSKQHA